MPELLLSILWTLGFYQHYWGRGREGGREGEVVRFTGSQKSHRAQVSSLPGSKG